MKINDHEIYVEVIGPEQGEVVVLLHHGLDSTRAWSKQVPALVQAGFRVIAYDRWGYGASDWRDSFDMPAFAQDQADLLCLLDSLEIAHPVLVGHSDGGTIALAFAARHPERVSKLVAIAAHVYVEAKMQTGILSTKASFDSNARFRSALERVHGEKYQQVFHNWFSGWYNKANLTWDLRPELSRITCPLWVVQGIQDEHATPQHAEDIVAAAPGARLWLVPEAGHMLPQDMPDVFNRRLLEFLGDLTMKAVIEGGSHVQ